MTDAELILMQKIEAPEINPEEQEAVEVTEPNLWRVIMLNDDTTTMDFVVQLLMYVFHRTETDAFEIMIRIHAEGQSVVGIYTHEVAEEKVNTCIRTARASNFPLQVIMEEDT